MFHNSLLPSVGNGVGSNAFPFLGLLWKISYNFYFFYYLLSEDLKVLYKQIKNTNEESTYIYIAQVTYGEIEV